MRANRGAQGYGGQVIVRADQPLEIVKDGATPGFLGASVRAADINALGADRISIGGSTAQSSISPDRLRFDVRGDDIYLRSGALLRAPEVLLMTSDTKSIVVERGAIINTLGMGAAPYDSRNGYRYGQSDSSVNVLAVSNGWLDFANGVSSQEAGIELGADCAVAACAAPARLYSDGTIAIGTSNLIVHDALRYGTRNLVLAANSLNVGNEAALADAAARGVLPPGLRLSQTLLSRLLIGDREMGAPALERVIFSMKNSVNFFGSVNLSTLNPTTGKSSLQQLVFNTPAMYGLGAAGDVASVSTDTLVWNGVADAPAGTSLPAGPEPDSVVWICAPAASCWAMPTERR